MGYKKAYKAYMNGVARMEAAILWAARDAGKMKKRLSSSFRRAYVHTGGFQNWMFCEYRYLDAGEDGVHPDVELLLRRAGADEECRMLFRDVRTLQVESAIHKKDARLKETLVFFHLKKKKKAVVSCLLFSSGMRLKIKCEKIKLRK